MKILITGISGFIGQALTKELLKLHHEVHGFYEHEKSMKNNSDTVHKHLINLLDFALVENKIHEIQPDVVIHLAARTEVALSFDNYLEVSQINYVGTVNLAEACRKHVPNFKLFLQASTMETYGQQLTGRAFIEETKQNPMAPYAVAKLACEYYLTYMYMSYGFPFCAFRQTNAYGRTDNDFFVVEQIITQMLKNPSVCNLGEPDAFRNFLYIDDLIALYLKVLENPEKVVGEFFVTGPNNAIPIRELAEIIKQKLNWKGEIRWFTKPMRPGEIFYLNSNPAKAADLLGWEPKISLSEGLNKTIEIWRKNYASEAEAVRPK